jgi:hypothetical protein
MRLLVLLPLALTACVNVVDGADDTAPAEPGRAPLIGRGADGPPPGVPADAPPADEPAAPPAQGELEAPETPDGLDEETGPPPEEDPDGDGVVVVAAAGPPPAETFESCAEWTDCGPHYDNLNSGFDCEDGTCTCDATGQWAQACANIGGSWSGWECFCFVGTATAMPSAAPERPSLARDDVRCWWKWRHTYCDPDRWVDTSYYERVCYGGTCYNEYVHRGYYVDGRCYGRWIKRCTDGREYWF